ncbi:hypothetical protein HS125_03260 [bacterium]|nr:hypothetical protein [bacterium]
MTRRILLSNLITQPDPNRSFTRLEQWLQPWCITPLLEHAHTIMTQERYFWCRLEKARVSLAYAGDCELCLGALVTLWTQGEFLQPCPKCGGAAYVVGVGGSPLSGNNSWGGLCPRCDAAVSGSAKPFAPLFQRAWNVGVRHPNPVMIEKGERARFSWKHGLVGKSTPDRILGYRHPYLPLPVILCELLESDPRHAERLEQLHQFLEAESGTAGAS